MEDRDVLYQILREDAEKHALPPEKTSRLLRRIVEVLTRLGLFVEKKG